MREGVKVRGSVCVCEREREREREREKERCIFNNKLAMGNSSRSLLKIEGVGNQQVPTSAAASDRSVNPTRPRVQEGLHRPRGAINLHQQENHQCASRAAQL